MGEGAAQLWWRVAVAGPGGAGIFPCQEWAVGKSHRIRTCNANNCRMIAGRNGTAVTQALWMYLALE